MEAATHGRVGESRERLGVLTSLSFSLSCESLAQFSFLSLSVHGSVCCVLVQRDTFVADMCEALEETWKQWKQQLMNELGESRERLGVFLDVLSLTLKCWDVCE